MEHGVQTARLDDNQRYAGTEVPPNLASIADSHKVYYGIYL